MVYLLLTVLFILYLPLFFSFIVYTKHKFELLRRQHPNESTQLRKDRVRSEAKEELDLDGGSDSGQGEAEEEDENGFYDEQSGEGIAHTDQAPGVSEKGLVEGSRRPRDHEHH